LNCTACGARLGAKQTARAAQPARTTRHQGRAREKSGLRGFEPWQIISFVAVGALVAVLLYVELSRDHVPAGASAASVAPATMPSLQAPPAADLEPLEAAVVADPKNQEALLTLANALHDNGMFLRAVETYKKYLHLQPKNPDARVDMGVCYYELGLADSVNRGRYFALATGEMEAAFRSAPTHQPSAFNLGVVTLQSGDVEASNRWFRKAVELGATSELGVKAQRLLEQHSFNP
jgi:tetratricopeptide (TPR) repeat protein